MNDASRHLFEMGVAMMSHVKGTGQYAYRTYPPDLFTPEPERQKAVNVLDRMAAERHAWLDRIRHVLVQVYYHRVMKWGRGHPEACVTGDDAQRLAKARPELALPAGASFKLFGAVFRAPGWVRSEHKDHVSTTPGSNGNLIYRWRYVGPQSNAV